jgi:hypothetical protein
VALAALKRVSRKSLTSSGGRDRPRAGHGAGRPALRRRLDDRPHERDEADARQPRARPVQPPPQRVARLRDEPAARDERDRGERHVDDEDRAPPEVVEQHAADGGAERDAEAGRCRPQADRRGPLARVGEDADEQRERRRHDQRRAGAHRGAGEDEPADVAGVGRAGRRDREDGEAAEQHPPAAEPVAERAGQQQQPREHERVRVDDPLQLADVRVQVERERRQRDVDDRVVDHDDEQAQAEHRERRPALARRGGHDAPRRAPPRALAPLPARRSRTRMTTASAISHRLQRT